MNILFITASRIGDAILSSGVLAHIARTYPDAKVTIACGPLAVSLFEGYPLLERILPLKKQKRHGHWIGLWRAVVGTRWDMVIDLRNSAVSRLIFARQRLIYGRHINKALHKVEQNAAVIRVSPPPAPHMWFTPVQREKAAHLMELDGDERPIVGVGPAANWLGKTWPADRFIAVLHGLTAKGAPYEGARVAVFGAPGEEAVCYQVLQALPEGQRLDLIAKGSPGEAAAMIARCDFYLGNDSGLMHAAAASGVKTFGVFGPSYPHLYRPWGDHCAYARTPESFDALINYPGYTPETAPCLMESLTVEAVQDGLARFFEETGSAAA